MNRGVGRRITTAAGLCTTVTGPGCRTASSTGTVVGGGRRSSLSSRLISRLETISAGIRCRITSAIHTRDSIDVTIRIMVAANVMVGEMVMDVMRVVDATVTDVTRAGGAPVMDVTDAKVKVASPADVLSVAMSIGAV